MFAIFKSGGKQHRVSVGDILRVEKLDLAMGSRSVLGDVVMLSDGDKVNLGKPIVSGAGVAVEVLEHGRDKKIIVFKRKRRKDYRRTRGHRQEYSLLKVIDILSDSSKFKGDVSVKSEAKKVSVAKKSGAKSVKAVAKKSAAKSARAAAKS